MITEWLIQVGAGFATWVASLLSPLSLPSWTLAVVPNLTAFISSASGLNIWIPWAAIGTSVGLLVVVYGGSFAVKLLRVAISHLPEIGGSG